MDSQLTGPDEELLASMSLLALQTPLTGNEHVELTCPEEEEDPYSQIKYPSIPTASKVEYTPPESTILSVTEKVHGCNFSFRSAGTGDTIFFSRNRQLLPGERFMGYMEALDNTRYRFLPEGLIVYGELYGTVQKEITYRKRNAFIAFDVFSTKTDSFLSLTEARKLCELINVPFVRTLFEGEADAVNNWVAENIEKTLSELTDESVPPPLIEGFVVREADGPFRVKHIASNYKEKKDGKVPKSQILLPYLTPIRVSKMKHNHEDKSPTDIAMLIVSEIQKEMSSDGVKWEKSMKKDVVRFTKQELSN